jgi:hypothetical protein
MFASYFFTSDRGRFKFTAADSGMDDCIASRVGALLTINDFKTELAARF